MTTVKIGSLQQATMVVGVVALATDSDNGISSDSQVGMMLLRLYVKRLPQYMQVKLAPQNLHFPKLP